MHGVQKMAGLELELDNLDGLDESIQSLYIENGDKFKLNVNGLDDAVAGKPALIAEREARKQANEKLNALQAQMQAAKDAAEKEKQDQMLANGEFEGLLKSAVEKQEALQNQILEMQQNSDKEKIGIAALKIGSMNLVKKC